ncbi:MAG: hypothetical protein IJQ26_04590, partial [Lachnospiraceae bacterium]|nr:hypothetical protein [Lachnospiraceae bacterium]
MVRLAVQHITAHHKDAFGIRVQHHPFDGFLPVCRITVLFIAAKGDDISLLYTGCNAAVAAAAADHACQEEDQHHDSRDKCRAAAGKTDDEALAALLPALLRRLLHLWRCLKLLLHLWLLILHPALWLHL